MKPVKRGELESHIEWAIVEFLSTGKSKKLGTRQDSVCHFFDPFMVGNDRIQLRLDWSDLDKHSNPKLDADFYDSKTNIKCSLRGERKNAHHTPATDGTRTYCWEFKNYKLPFKVNIGWLLSADATTGTSCSISLKINQSE